MVTRFFSSVWFCILSITVISCGPSEITKELVIARVGEQNLFEKDLKDLFGEQALLSDLNVKVYVHNWIRNEVVLQSADKLLLEKEKDFSKAILAYKNSLLRYTLESKYVDDHIDTVVSKDQLRKYYHENSSNFELKENHVKIRVLKLDSGFKDMNQGRKLFNYIDSLGKYNFDQWAEKNDVMTLVQDSVWTRWESVKEIVPLKFYNDAYFLSNNQYKEIWKNGTLWLVKITDYQLKDTQSPFEMVETKIKSILINKRKMGLIKIMEKQLYDQALEKGEITINLN